MGSVLDGFPRRALAHATLRNPSHNSTRASPSTDSWTLHIPNLNTPPLLLGLPLQLSGLDCVTADPPDDIVYRCAPKDDDAREATTDQQAYLAAMPAYSAVLQDDDIDALDQRVTRENNRRAGGNVRIKKPGRKRRDATYGGGQASFLSSVINLVNTSA